MKIIFLNGPPHCGKDSAADRLFEANRSIIRMKFADPLKDSACGMLGITREEFERIKDRPHPALNGETPRKFVIRISEELIKPNYGDQFFGKLAVGRMDKLPPNAEVYFSDSGFASEAIPVVAAFGISNIVKIEIEREGKDFSNDSRSYWTYPGMRVVRIKNDSSITVLADRIWRASH